VYKAAKALNGPSKPAAPTPVHHPNEGQIGGIPWGGGCVHPVTWMVSAIPPCMDQIEWYSRPSTWLVGAIAAGWAEAWGAECRFDMQYGMNVCYGAYVPGAARGGTTFGRTFISQEQPDPNGPYIDPKTLGDPIYSDLMEHEFAHVRQYDMLGPIRLGVMYGINEVIAGIAGWKPGCGNVFERGCRAEEGRIWVLIRRVALAVLAAVLLSGCVYMLPSAVLDSSYLMNRGGKLYVGVRCFPSLDRVEVSMSGTGGEPFWVAVATGPGVGQFELLGDGQPGVRVVLDDPGRRADGSWSVRIWLPEYDTPRYSSPQEGSRGGIDFDYIPPGWVSSGAGIMSWEDYVRLPDVDFGVGNPQGKCN
jgi:hypothetical protein